MNSVLLGALGAGVVVVFWKLYNEIQKGRELDKMIANQESQRILDDELTKISKNISASTVDDLIKRNDERYK